MSQHPSLKFDPTKTKHRNVLKRYERIWKLKETEKWQDRQSALGLPKVKSMKIKVKKIKEEKAEAAAQPGAARSAGSPAPVPAAAGTAAPKAAGPKKKGA